MSASAFYKSQQVLHFMWDVLGIRDISDQKIPLTDSQRIKFTREIKGIKIETTHRGEFRKKHVVRNVTRRSAQMQT